MFVRKRSWSEARYTHVYGKIHWMIEPWVTKCGMQVVNEWELNPIWSSRDGCKKCGLGGQE